MVYTTQAPSNYQQKCLCVLLLDVSGSMGKEHKLDSLNESVEQLYEDIIKGRNGVSASTKDRLFVEVISFDQAPHRIQPYMLLSTATKPPVLKTRGSTTDTVRAIDFAIDELESHKKMLLSTGQKYYRPWLVLVTDGNPTSSKEEIDRIAKKIKKNIAEGHMFMTAVGVGTRIDTKMLHKLSGGNGVKIENYSFSKFFSWLANSTDQIFNSDDEFDRIVDSDENFL